MRIEPEISGADIIVFGTLNPAIFTPAWFVLCNLLPKGTEERSDLTVAHPQVTTFAADWLRLEVTDEYLGARTEEAPYIRLCDLVVRTFREFLNHTPLRAFGINRDVHFPVPSRADRDRIGRLLAPVEPWGVCGRDLELDAERGGMTSLTMSQFRPAGRPTGGRINVKVEPSVRIPDERGVYVRINDHYTLGDAESTAAADGTRTERLMDMLQKNFDESLKRANMIIDHLMSLATVQEEP